MEQTALPGAGGAQQAVEAQAEDMGLVSDIGVRDHPRFHQMFPQLAEAEIERARRYGTPCHFTQGSYLYRAGSVCPGVFLLLAGKVRISGREGLREGKTIHVYSHRGEFTSDVTQLSDKPAVVDARVLEDVDAVLLRPEALSRLMINEADIGETIIRALILRRVLVLERGQGVVLLGRPGDPGTRTLQNFLRRNAFPQTTLDAEHDADAMALLARLTPQHNEFPLVVCPDGKVLRNPDERLLASCLGLIPEFDPNHVYDLAIVGAGPAGLAAAVYAASEGLSVAVLDCRAPGGQAGTSARIENYLGFPTGITGHALAGRAFVQAQKFGAHIGIPCEVTALQCDRHPRCVVLADGQRISARTVVIASGAEYRRPRLANLADFECSGVYYWATPVEAKLCRKEPVLLLGGGNSAGQAAVFLASHAQHVHVFIRGPSLAQSMSRYLVDRIGSLPNVTVHTHTELTALEGDGRLERVRYRAPGGVEGSMSTRHLFVFIGADPKTEWLGPCGIALDSKGFVLTGSDLCSHQNPALPLQTSAEGVFAIGDARSGSIKRVASAVGEGAAVVSQIHRFLNEHALADNVARA